MQPDAFERLRERLAHVDPDQGWFFGQVAEKVAHRRKERGLSQAELAELTGTTQSAIARLEAGEGHPGSTPCSGSRRRSIASWSSTSSRARPPE